MQKFEEWKKSSEHRVRGLFPDVREWFYGHVFLVLRVFHNTPVHLLTAFWFFQTYAPTLAFEVFISSV